MPVTRSRAMLGASSTKEATVPVAVKNVSLVRNGCEKFAAGDVEGVIAMFSPELMWTVPGPARS
jgi:hypothetical protein